MTKRNWIRAGLLPSLALSLAACDSPADRREAVPDRTGAAAPSARDDAMPPSPAIATRAAPPPATPKSCAAEMGEPAANRRVAICRAVSPATRPPCHAANSCAMIETEIARSCALLDKGGALPADCRPDPDSRDAAIDVVKRYYSALDARDYDTAWSQWVADGPPNQSRDKFAAGFAHTRSTHVTIGKAGDTEGAAGSIYLTVPVTVDATLDSGARQRFQGEYILRRVNDVDGATADQLRWHIASARLRSLP